MPYGLNRNYFSLTPHTPITYHAEKHTCYPYNITDNRNIFPEYKHQRIMNRSPYIMRNNVTNTMQYSPYPTASVTQQQQQQQQQTHHFLKADHGNINGKTGWPFDQNGEFCTDILNRDKHYWTDEETALMLELFEENRDYFTDSRTKKTKIWSIIANMINKKFSTNINSEQCGQKYRNLKAEYLKLSEQSPVETERKFGKHYTQMKRLIEDEERSYLMQENNWLANDRVATSNTSNLQSMIISGNKASPSNNNHIRPESDDELKPDNQLNLPVMSCMSSVATTSSIQMSTSNRSPGTLSDDTSTNSIKTPDLLNEAESKAIDTLIGLEQQKNSSSESSICSNTPSDDLNQPIGEGEEKIYTKLDLPLKSNEHQQQQQQQQHQVGQKNNKTDESFTKEVAGIFSDYMTTRNKMLENYETKELENIKCMSKCVEIFYRVLKEKLQK